MFYQKVDTSQAFRIFTGGSTVTVSSKSISGVSDIMTAAWNCPFDADQILVVLASTHTTTENILKTSKFVVAIPEVSQKALILKVGSIHGRDCGDKFEATGVPYEVSEKLQLKVIPNCLAYFECELADQQLLANTGICMGNVINLYVREGLWDNKEHNFAKGAKLALHHVTEDKFITGGEDA